MCLRLPHHKVAESDTLYQPANDDSYNRHDRYSSRLVSAPVRQSAKLVQQENAGE
jgi:hypothetical protein